MIHNFGGPKSKFTKKEYDVQVKIYYYIRKKNKADDEKKHNYVLRITTLFFDICNYSCKHDEKNISKNLQKKIL